jgi:hypothetical protein
MFIVAACMGGVETTLTPFHTFPDAAAPQGKTFIMLPSASQEGSLQWAQYSNMVAQKLESKGLRRVDNARTADYAVALYYGIDGGRTEVSSYPTYGQTSPGVTSTGYVGSRPVSIYTPPTYGYTGTSTSSNTVYGRAIRINIMDVHQSMAQNKRVLVYEATGKSEGTSGDINAVLPSIIDAMFIDWPGKSGVSQTKQVPLRQQR